MVISKTPLRISFVGGGTDLPDFYSKYPGRVLSTAIDKYVYINFHQKFAGDVRMVYSQNEQVRHVSELKHTRVKAALEKFSIERGIEIMSSADIPARDGGGSGLGSSSSFTVGLLNGLYAYTGLKKSITPQDLAEEAAHLEINVLREPIGKQDQYAAACGGMNFIQFNQDGSVLIEPLYLDHKIKNNFKNHLLLFFTGQSRDASSILSEQNQKLADKFETYKKMSDSVINFREALERGDFKMCGEILNQNWLWKKSLASNISNNLIDEMYQKAIVAGAWGGKILGAGGGGSLLVLAPPEKHQTIREALADYLETPFEFVESGSKIVYKD